MADRPQQNIYNVGAADEWPEAPDPFILYHKTYTPDPGIYYWEPLIQDYLQLTSTLWVFAFSGVKGYYGFDDTGQTPQDPLTGYVRLNAVQASAATEIYASNITGTGLDLEGIFNIAAVDDSISLENKTLGQTQVYAINAPLTDNGTWWTIPVSPNLGNAGNWAQDNIIVLGLLKDFTS